MRIGARLKDARLDSGLTQSELAQRMRTTQSAIARLESPRANPRFLTLESAFAAMGKRFELDIQPAIEIDRTLFAAHLGLSPLERVRAHDAASSRARGLLARVKRLPPVTP